MLKERMSRMFEGLRTWNPYFGCQHHCYKDGCWANKKLAHRLGKGNKCHLCYDFKPHIHAERLNRVPPDPRIFVVAHGDLFGWWVARYWILKILEVCRETSKEMWFFETKNPGRYLEFLGLFPKNTMLSTTIETNRDSSLYRAFMGSAPYPAMRYSDILKVSDKGKYPIHISNEPIMDFDFCILVSWMRCLRPNKVSVGYDSLKNNLPEPSKAKTLKYIDELERFTEVERKLL